MYKQKIEILKNQARTYLMMAKAVPEGKSRSSYLASGKQCVILAMELEKLDRKQANKNYKLNLVK